MVAVYHRFVSGRTGGPVLRHEDAAGQERRVEDRLFAARDSAPRWSTGRRSVSPGVLGCAEVDENRRPLRMRPPPSVMEASL